MATATLRPDGTVEVGANWTIGGGAATHHAAQSDNSDATYSQGPIGSYELLSLDVGTFAFPALSQIRSVTWRARCSFPGYVAGDTARYQIWLDAGLAHGISFDILDASSVGTTITTVTGPAKAAAPDGVPWTQAIVDLLRPGQRFGGGGGSTTNVRFYELYVDVVYNEAPVVTVTAPTGATVATSTPTITHTYSDPEGDAQERVWRKVFSQVQYTQGDFDPEISTAVWDSGEVLNAATSAAVGVALENGTYRAYVKASDAGSGARYGTWSYIGFTVATEPPAVPDIVSVPIVADGTLNRVVITVLGRDNYLTANQSTLETDTVGWAALANCSIARSTSFSAAGLASLRVTATGAGDCSVATPAYPNGFPVAEGYTVGAYFEARAATVGRSVDSSMVFYDSAGANLGGGSAAGSDVGGEVTTAFDDFEYRWNPPAGAATARMVVTIRNCGAGEVHYLDKLGAFLRTSTPYGWTVGGYSTTSRVIVERSDDGGVTWVAVRGLNRVATQDPATQRVDGYDFEAPRGVELRYRARVAGSSDLASPVSANTAEVVLAAGVPPDGQSWLKSYLDPSLNTPVCLLKDSVDSTSTEDQGIFEAQGRPDPLIHGGTVRLEVFDGLEFWFNNDAEWDAFEAIRALKVPILLQTCFGDDGKDEWWIRFGPTRTVHRVTHDDMGVSQYRSAKIGARQVLGPQV